MNTKLFFLVFLVFVLLFGCTKLDKVTTVEDKKVDTSVDSDMPPPPPDDLDTPVPCGDDVPSCGKLDSDAPPPPPN